MAKYSENREWKEDNAIHFNVRDDFDGDFHFVLAACYVSRVEGQIDFTYDRTKVTCQKCKESDLYLNPNLSVI